MTGVQRLLEAGLILTGAFSLFLLTALVTFHPADPGWSQAGYTQEIQNAAGAVGAWVSDLMLFSLGITAFTVPFLVMLAGYFLFYTPRQLVEIDYLTLGLRLIGIILLIAGCTGLASLNLTEVYSVPAGGVLGAVISDAMLPYFNVAGSLLLLLTFVLSGITLISGISWLSVVDSIGKWTIRGLLFVVDSSVAMSRKVFAARDSETGNKVNADALETSAPKTNNAAEKSAWWQRLLFWQKKKGPQSEPAQNEADTEDERSEWDRLPLTPTKLERSLPLPSVVADRNEPVIDDDFSLAESEIEAEQELEPEDTESQEDWPESEDEADTPAPAFDPLPSLALLDRPNQKENPLSQEELDQISRTVEAVLKDFGVEVQVAGVQPGPVITRFELDLAPGVKVSKISNLAKDIARSLSAIAVRVVEVIPGKSYVGLELPNKHREIVRLSEVLESEGFAKSPSPLSMVLGKDIAGKPVTVDLAKMPHLLVAGTTGSGKSVGINVMILSMLYKSQPEDVRMIMIDPKMLELSVYDGIPHLLTEVVTDMKDAANALRWCVGEMERRYRLMSALGVRNVKGYNEKVMEAIAAGT